MVVHCTVCHHETAVLKNNKPCAWCSAPMKAIGDCYMSVSDGSLSTDEVKDENTKIIVE